MNFVAHTIAERSRQGLQLAREAMRGKNLTGQLLRGGIGGGVVKVASLALGLALSILLARLLGPQQFGLYSFVFALVSVMAVPAQVGLPTLVVRETARAQAGGDWGRVRGIWRWASGAALVASAALVGLGVLASLTLGDAVPALRTATFYWGLALIPLIALGNLRGAALRGLGKVVQGLLPEFIITPGLFVLLLAGALLLGQALAAEEAMALNAAAAAAAFLAGAAILYRARPAQLAAKPKPDYDGQAWRRSAVPLALIAGMAVVMQYTDIIMLGLLRTEAEVGIYRVAAQWSRLVLLGFMVVEFVVPPYFARLHTQGDGRRLQALANKSAQIATLLALPIFLAFALLAETFVTVLFGSAYAGAATPLAILASGQLLVAMTGVAGPLLTMTGHERNVAVAMLLGVASNTSLNALLIPQFGMNGSAVATAASLVLWRIVLTVRAKSRLGSAGSPT